MITNRNGFRIYSHTRIDPLYADDGCDFCTCPDRTGKPCPVHPVLSDPAERHRKQRGGDGVMAAIIAGVFAAPIYLFVLLAWHFRAAILAWIRSVL